MVGGTVIRVFHFSSEPCSSAGYKNTALSNQNSPSKINFPLWELIRNLFKGRTSFEGPHSVSCLVHEVVAYASIDPQKIFNNLHEKFTDLWWKVREINLFTDSFCLKNNQEEINSCYVPAERRNKHLAGKKSILIWWNSSNKKRCRS